MTDTELPANADLTDRLSNLEGELRDTRNAAWGGVAACVVACVAACGLWADSGAKPAAVDTRDISQLVDTHYIPKPGAHAVRELRCFDDVESRNVGLARIRAAIDAYVVPTGAGGVRFASPPKVQAASGDDDVRDPARCLVVLYPGYGL